jgi:hypothetical protein
MRQNMRRLFAVLAVLFLAVGGIGAQAGFPTVPASDTITAEANSGFELTLTETSEYLEQPFEDDESIRDTGGYTLGSTGEAAVTVGDLDWSDNQTITIDDATPKVTLSGPTRLTSSFEGSLSTITYLETVQANDDTPDLTYTATGSASIEFEDVAPDQPFILQDVDTGETVAFGNSDTTGTVTFDDIATGTHTVALESYFVEVREIAPDNPLVENVNITVKLYEEDSDRVFVRETSSGVFQIADLPPNKAFAITAEADGYVTRQTLIESPEQQSVLYLLNNSTDTQLTRFNIDDRTGDFNEDVRIQIERSINTTDSAPNEERYQVVAGDIVGSQLEFDTTLERDVRYRITVANDRGDERQLGSFLIKSDRVIDLVVSGINVGYDQDDEGLQIDTAQSVNETSGDKTVRAVLQDPTNSTTDVRIEVVPFNDQANVIDSAETAGPIGEFSYQTTITGEAADERLVAKISYSEDGELIETVLPFGSDTSDVLAALDPDWRSIFGVGFLLVLGGVFSVANARVGAIMIPGVAMALNLTGILTNVVTATSIGLAFAVAVGINIVRGSGGLTR